ncbi:MAG TPA: phosphate ABC transporter ATP-binding protein PstB [Candidatus Limnocylindrales bacterium]|nr:phosphate ABC transporter ATP-binding protein PstB [Candidatus Limnocylindrales bacterium]
MTETATPEAPAPLPDAPPVTLRVEQAPESPSPAEPPSSASSEASATSDVSATSHVATEPVIQLQDLGFYYGSFRAVKNVTLEFAPRKITALIGPSGCGKSTLLRTINRMNDLIPGTRVEGQALYHGVDLYGKDVDAVEVRRRIGMVFQKPNPFPKSIYDNVAFGPKINGFKGDMDELVEASLKRAALWNEVKDKLKQSGLALSGGQQQRLCIARAIATSPDVILMDEPASALDPRSTLQIEELMFELRENYTIIIVTHNMQQAARASDRTAFLNMADDRAGYVVEQGPTLEIFTNPKNQMTEDYVSGRFG